MDLVVALSERLTVLLKIIYHNIKRYQTNIIDHNGVVFVGLLVINLKRSGQPTSGKGTKQRGQEEKQGIQPSPTPLANRPSYSRIISTIAYVLYLVWL